MWLRKRNLHTHTHKQFSTHETKQKTKTKNQIPTLDYSNSLQRPVLPNMRLIRVCQTMLLLQLPDLCQLLPRSVRPKLTKASCLPRPCPQLWNPIELNFVTYQLANISCSAPPPPKSLAFYLYLGVLVFGDHLVANERLADAEVGEHHWIQCHRFDQLFQSSWKKKIRIKTTFWTARDRARKRNWYSLGIFGLYKAFISLTLEHSFWISDSQSPTSAAVWRRASRRNELLKSAPVSYITCKSSSTSCLVFFM